MNTPARKPTELRMSQIKLEANFNDMIIGGAAKAGVHSPIDGAMLKVIASFLQEMYPRTTVKYFHDAFNHYAADKLDFKDKVFDNFNPAFIGKVLSSFAEYRAKHNRRVPPAKNYAAAIEEKSVLDPEKEKSRSYDFIDGVFSVHGKPPIIGSYGKAYLYAVEKNLLNLSQEEIAKAKQHAENDIRLDAKNKKENRQPYRHLLRKIEQGNSAELEFEHQKGIMLAHFYKKYSK